MAIDFPTWYAGGWPDLELVVCDMLQPYLELLTPHGTAVTWLPKGIEDLIATGAAVVRIHRGGLGADGLIDMAAIQLGVISGSREDSWAVLEYLRQIMRSYARGGSVRRADSSTTELMSVEEMLGPQQWPELNPDHRLVVAPFRVNCRLPRGLPDYARIRESLAQ